MAYPLDIPGYTRTGAGTLTFTCNGLDDRMAMVLASGTRRIMYDADGRVMSEYGASATDVKAELDQSVRLGEPMAHHVLAYHELDL